MEEDEKIEKVTLSGTFLQLRKLKEIQKSKWKRILISEKEHDIEEEKGTLLKTIQTVTKEYVFSIHVKFTKIHPTAIFLGIFQMTTNRKNGDYGSRNPSIAVVRNKTSSYSAVNSDKKWGYKTELFRPEINKWYNIKISQIVNEQGEYQYIVKVNGDVKRDVINNDPAAFTNVKCFVASPWEKAQSGTIKDIWIDVLNFD